MHPERPAALITGSARRIGAAIARRLHAAGFDLLLHYRQSQREMATLCATLNAERADSTHAVAADLADADAPARLVAAAMAHFGRLDALVNNASRFFDTPVGNASAADWDALFGTNARAPFFLAQAAAPHLRAARGCIVNLTDIYAERPLPNHPLYCMSKSALAMMTQALARELAPDVRVNAVAPGAVLWPDAGKAEIEQRALLQRTPLARVGTPDDVAEAVRWLIQDAPYCTGQTIRVDGGRTLFM